jgi:hypothetical protein
MPVAERVAVNRKITPGHFEAEWGKVGHSGAQVGQEPKNQPFFQNGFSQKPEFWPARIRKMPHSPRGVLGHFGARALF